MRRTLPLVAALLFATLPVVTEAQGPGAASAGMLAGEVALDTVPHPSQGVEWGRAEGVVNARAEDVLAIIHDYAQYAGIFPYFQKSRVMSQRGTDAIVYLEASILHGASTLWTQVRFKTTQQSPGIQVVEASMMKGKGNIDQLLARWVVKGIEGGQRTLVTFQLLVDPDLPVPDMVITAEMKKGAGQAFRALRRRVAQRVSIATRPQTSM